MTEYIPLAEAISIIQEQHKQLKNEIVEAFQGETIMRERRMLEAREEFANLCHEQWAGWMKYLFSKTSVKGEDVVIPAEFVERWYRQMNTPYTNLSESEQNSDRNEADKFLKLFIITVF